MAIVAAGAWLMASCGPDVEARRATDLRPNVLLVSMDTTRADHLSAYGYPRATSVQLEALAAAGVRFEQAYAPSATTGPSHASLFTSLHPITHGVLQNGHPLSGELDTLAALLAGEGYETGAVVSSYVLSARFGYGKGFGSYDEDFSRATTPTGVTLWEGQEIEGKFYGSAEDTTRRAVAWLEERKRPQAPFFLFVHYFDPHEPYVMPPGYTPPFSHGAGEDRELEHKIFLYDVLIAFTDSQIGSLLRELERRKLAGNTIVVVTGDHGEGLMQRGYMFHGVHIYEEGVRVPLVFRWPGRLAAGRVVRHPVDLLDVAPTLLELVGAPQVAAPFAGRSLAGLLREGAAPEPAPRPIFLFRRPYDGEELAAGVTALGEKFAVRLGRWKLIEGPAEGTVELFDLETDPGERNNLAARHPERVARLSARIAAWRREQGRASDPPPIDEQDRARLGTLGYVE